MALSFEGSAAEKFGPSVFFGPVRSINEGRGSVNSFQSQSNSMKALFAHRCERKSANNDAVGSH